MLDDGPNHKEILNICISIAKICTHFWLQSQV